MTAASSARPPFDTGDAAIAERYVRGCQREIFDPFGTAVDEDLILKPSLSGARLIIEESFATVRSNGQPFRGFPFIVDRPALNACAVEKAGLQLFGLDVGLVNAAFEISLFVFSRATLFTEIGDAAAEASAPLPPGSQLAFVVADKLRRRGTADGPPVGLELLPRDGRRLFAAHALTQLLLRFVWLHELFHALNGHTGLLASRHSGGAALNEMPEADAIGAIEVETDEDAGPVDGLRHLMEFDADRSALWALLRMQQTDCEPIVGLAAWPRPLRLKLAIFAAATMTFLFDQAGRRVQTTGGHHPVAHDRLLDLVRTIASNLMESAGEVREAFAAALAEMTALQADLPGFVSVARLLADLRSTELQRAFDGIDNALAAARGMFAPFAYRRGPKG